MAQRLHLVFGGDLVAPEKSVFRDVSKIHIAGIFPDHPTAFAARKGQAQRRVDHAHRRYFTAHMHRLREDGSDVSGRDSMGV